MHSIRRVRSVGLSAPTSLYTAQHARRHFNKHLLTTPTARLTMASTAPLPETFVAGWHDEASVRRMPYRKFGDRTVSQLSFGASSLAGVFRGVDKAECLRVVEHAVRAGINVIDTAPWYGHGASESILGEALKGIPRRAYYVHTKVCRYNPGPLEMFDFSYERTLKSVDESLARLQLDYIDTVQVHDPEFAPSLDVVIKETLPALAEARRQGKIKYIGITGYPLEALRYLAEHATVPVHTCISYCHFNLHDRSLVDDGTLAFLAGKGIAVLNASPLSMGLLTTRGPPAWHPAKPAIRERCAAAAAYCAERGVDIATLALHYCLAQPDIPTTLISTASLDRLKHDIEVTQGAHPLSPAEQAALEHVLATYFSGPDYASIQSWEGVEVGAYNAKLGKTLLARWYERKAAARAAGGDASAVEL